MFEGVEGFEGFKVQLPAAFKGLRVQLPAAFNCLRRSIACGVQLPAAFNCLRRLRFNCLRRSRVQGSIACGVQGFKVQLPAAFKGLNV
jgi:hypothetical protein